MAQIVRFSGLDKLDVTPVQRAANTILDGRKFDQHRGTQMMEQARRNGDDDLFKKGYKIVYGKDWEDSVNKDAKDLSVDDIDLDAQKSALSKALGTGKNATKPATAEEWEAQKQQWQTVLGSDALTSHKDLTDEGEEKFWSKQRSHGSSPLTGMYDKYGRDDSAENMDKQYFEGNQTAEDRKKPTISYDKLSDDKKRIFDKVAQYSNVQMDDTEKRAALGDMIVDMAENGEISKVDSRFVDQLVTGKINVDKPQKSSPQESAPATSPLTDALIKQKQWWGDTGKKGAKAQYNYLYGAAKALKKDGKIDRLPTKSELMAAVNEEAPTGMAPETIFDNQDAEREKDRLTTDFADKIMEHDNRHVSPLNMKRYADKLRHIQEWEQKAMSRTDPNDYARMTMIRDKGNQLREEVEQQYGHLFRTFDNRQNPYLDMYKEDQKNRRSRSGSGGKMVYLDIPGEENKVISESEYRANLEYYNRKQAKPTFVGTEQPGDVDRKNAEELERLHSLLEITDDPKARERLSKMIKDLEHRIGTRKKFSHYSWVPTKDGKKLRVKVFTDGSFTADLGDELEEKNLEVNEDTLQKGSGVG